MSTSPQDNVKCYIWCPSCGDNYTNKLNYSLRCNCSATRISFYDRISNFQDGFRYSYFTDNYTYICDFYSEDPSFIDITLRVGDKKLNFDKLISFEEIKEYLLFI